MNKTVLLLAAGASALAISSASAADLIIDTPVETGVVQASGNWDGAFIGVFGGYGWGELDPGPAPFAFPDPAGWLLGVNAGANFTLDNGIVLGVVGDIAWPTSPIRSQQSRRLPSPRLSTGPVLFAVGSASMAAPSYPT